jgi:hypothetical protein
MAKDKPLFLYEEIANGDLTGKATNEVIAACQTAVLGRR